MPSTWISLAFIEFFSQLIVFFLKYTPILGFLFTFCVAGIIHASENRQDMPKFTKACKSCIFLWLLYLSKEMPSIAIIKVLKLVP